MTNPLLRCIGHRGAMGHAPENTIAAIQKALELGASFIEVDVYFVDNQLVVFHDERLERTTNGQGYIEEQSFDYLRSLDAGHAQLIPTLAEVCDALYSKGCINIELKGKNTAEPVAEFVASLLQKGWHPDAILISSFDHHQLIRIKRLIPDIKIGALICGIPLDYARFAEDLDAYSIHLSREFINPQFVEDAHSRNLQVYVYTVDHSEDIKRCQQLGVDGVFTNFPERVINNYTQKNLTSW